MERVEPRQLIAFRFKTGLTQAVLALNIPCHRTTVVRWEETGRIKTEHLAALKQLANDIPGTGTTLLKPLGRPQKTWKLRPARNDRDERLIDLRYYLFKPEHADHLWEIWAPPVGEGDNWLEWHKGDPSNKHLPKVWFRWERGANMTERVVSVFAGASRSQMAEHDYTWQAQTRNPRLFTNYEVPAWEDRAKVVAETAQIHGYAMPEADKD